MDALVERSIKLVDSKVKTSVPWEFDKPCEQPHYGHDGKSWVARPRLSTTSPNITRLALYSWNIDFMLPYSESRMKAALEHLKERVGRSEDTATVMYLQECVESDLQIVADQPWIQENFFLSDIDTSNWHSGHYGTITVIDNRLSLSGSFRVHYSETRMQRDVLVTDVLLQHGKIRLCNSHLESLAHEPPRRIPQMKLIASYMHAVDVDAGIAAGDFNAIQPFDKTLHSDNNLLDAYLEQGGSEDDPNGHTWGQQAATVQRERFGTTRMDKVFFTPSPDVLRLLSFEKFGQDVLVPDEQEAADLMKLGFEKPWVTDHLGVAAIFDIILAEPMAGQKL